MSFAFPLACSELLQNILCRMGDSTELLPFARYRTVPTDFTGGVRLCAGMAQNVVHRVFIVNVSYLLNSSRFF